MNSRIISEDRDLESFRRYYKELGINLTEEDLKNVERYYQDLDMRHEKDSNGELIHIWRVCYSRYYYPSSRATVYQCLLCGRMKEKKHGY